MNMILGLSFLHKYIIYHLSSPTVIIDCSFIYFVIYLYKLCEQLRRVNVYLSLLNTFINIFIECYKLIKV